MVSEDRLKNWAWFCAWGHVGPEVRTTAASAEGNYESEDVFEGEEPRLEPDMIDGQIVENAIRNLPEMSRKVLKARYIMYPYHLKHTVAQRLRISVDRLESELHIAKRRLYDRLQRNPARDRGVAESSVGVSDSIPCQ
jgi:DNA-directed RNA polymerase specialized sigma24 family protein